MRALFSCEIGLSDHTMGVGAAVAAVAYGASIVENTSRCAGPTAGWYSAFSLEPEEMASLVLRPNARGASLAR
jgi:N-acetylneuraminate synthase